MELEKVKKDPSQEMILVIRKESLRKLLHERSDRIFLNRSSLIGEWFAVVSLIFSLSCIQFDQLPTVSLFITMFVVIFTLGYVFVLCSRTIKSWRNKYSIEQLCIDLENISERDHCFSLLIFHTEHPENGNQFLLRYDKRWKCWMFPYTRTGLIENFQKEKTYLYEMLGITANSVNLKKIMMRSHYKRSVPDNVDKKYIHTFFEVELIDGCENKQLEKHNFTHGKVKYKWFTLDEMLNNTNIMQKNGDVVESIRDYYA